MSSIASALAMLLGKASRRDPTQAAVGTDLVEVSPPFRDGRSGLVQRLELMRARHLDDLVLAGQIDMSLTTRLVAPISSDDRRELAAAILQLLRDAVATFQYTVFAYETGPRLRTHSVVDLDARRFYALGGNQRILATAASRAPSRLTLYQQAPEDIEQHVYSLACYRQPRICDRIALISRQRDEVWLSVNSYHDSGRERFQPGEIARIEALAVKRN